MLRAIRADPLIASPFPPAQSSQLPEKLLIDMFHLLGTVLSVTLDVAELAHRTDQAHIGSPSQLSNEETSYSGAFRLIRPYSSLPILK
jgi:hypothetical protein